MMRTRFGAVTGLLGATLLACNEDADRTDPCGISNTFAFEGADYCVVIDEEFRAVECPPGLSAGREFEQFVICTNAESIADAIEQQAWERGFGAPPPCIDGEQRDAGDGCNSCVCNAGTWMCTTAECSPLQECIASCADCEIPGEVSYVGETPDICMVIDYSCDEGFEGFSNECGCGCKPVQTAGCTEGATRMEACNTCVCMGGEWQCDTQDCTVLQTCLSECGDGCVEERFQVCSEDGESYCSACVAACYGVVLAPDREPCDCPEPAGESLEVRPLEIPEGCVQVEPEGGQSGVAVSIFEAAGWFLCEPNVSIPVEFGVEVLVRAVFPENPEPSVQGAFLNEATGEVLISLTAPQYCGGPAPTDSVRYFYLPAAEGRSWVFETCVHTACSEFFP